MLTRPLARLVSLLGQRKRRPLSPGRLVSRPGAVLPVCTVKGVLTILGVLEADELHLARLDAGGLVACAAGSFSACWWAASWPAWRPPPHYSPRPTAAPPLLPPPAGKGMHCHKQSASSFKSVSSVPVRWAWMVGSNLMVKAALKKAVPSSPGGQYSSREASTSDGCWLLLATTCRHLVAFWTSVSW